MVRHAFYLELAATHPQNIARDGESHGHARHLAALVGAPMRIRLAAMRAMIPLIRRVKARVDIHTAAYAVGETQTFLAIVSPKLAPLSPKRRLRVPS